MSFQDPYYLAPITSSAVLAGSSTALDYSEEAID